MTSSIALSPRLTQWTGLSYTNLLWNLRNISYAVAGLFLVIIGGAYWIRSRKNTSLARINPEEFCKQRHITILANQNPCINDLIYLRFDKKYAQGIVQLQKEALPVSNVLYLYCREKGGHCFEFQRITQENFSLPLFIQNMPYQEEMTLQIFTSDDLDEKPLWEKTFKVDHPLALYSLNPQNKITVKPYAQPQQSIPMGLESQSMTRSLIIRGIGIEPGELTEGKYVFKNLNPHLIKLHLGFYFKLPNGDVYKTLEQGEKVEYQHATIPIMIKPHTKVELSDDFITKTWYNVFVRAIVGRNTKTSLTGTALQLRHVQIVQYEPE